MTTFINIDNIKHDEICAICLENINIKNNSITLDCQHNYCKDCIDNLFSSKLYNKCPLCRKTIDLNKCTINENIEDNNIEDNNNNIEDNFIEDNFIENKNIKNKNIKNKNIKNKNIKNNNSSNFIHFETKNICNKFLRKAKYKLIIEHSCCGGKGCKISNLTKEQITSLKKNFLENNIINNN